ncbi:MAG: NAD-dependent protein deacetylase [Candidatus Aquiluna sp. XM-24bin5]|nr:MAG: NAD-dependent protein deacetylase [Candidatus Aquiluna sp. XM-24bin5]
MTDSLSPAISYSVERAREYLSGKKTLVISGAGISTDSGIPDYRGEGRVQKHPLTFDEFMGSRANQARYWARSYVGWNRIANAQPNAGHRAIAEAEKSGLISSIITQNVDGLHQKAGSKSVLELHGRLDRVLCVGCGDSFSRLEMDERIAEANPSLIRDFSVEFSPDGDAEVEVPEGFTVPDCATCGSHYKPDVVFFGEQVPKPRVADAEARVEAAEAVLVAGSSLTVNSGLRLVKRAVQAEKPVVIVNLGSTRADELANVRINGSTSELLGAIFG